MTGYTKLFNSILASTIWRADDKTRIVWITMLAMADKDGICEGSVPGLADFARVSIEDCEKALLELSSPDPYSRTSEHEGRRIEHIDGVGWFLINHPKYRAKMSEDERREYNRKKQAEWRAKEKGDVKDRQTMSKDVNDNQSLSAMSAHTEADSYSDSEANTDSESIKRLIERAREEFSDLDSRLVEMGVIESLLQRKKDAPAIRSLKYFLPQIQMLVAGSKGQKDKTIDVALYTHRKRAGLLESDTTGA